MLVLCVNNCIYVVLKVHYVWKRITVLLPYKVKTYFMPYYVWKRHAILICILILDGQDNPHGEQELVVPHILNPFLSNIETF